ncbi:hypothetical protein LY78DRAFT_139272 [Colletotrichum sublineola]|nr:hypothetical protein LY78DRAFT_139272 [Colletotrichum sublineola]
MKYTPLAQLPPSKLDQKGDRPRLHWSLPALTRLGQRERAEKEAIPIEHGPTMGCGGGGGGGGGSTVKSWSTTTDRSSERLSKHGGGCGRER